MKLNIPKVVLEIIERFRSSGFEIYIVGGAVRDILMKNPIYDWDFTTNAEPEKIQEILGEDSYYMGFGTVGFPTDGVGDRPFEITTFRKEFGYSDKRRPDKVEWGETLDEDLKRRDFTINAMALKPINELSSYEQSERLEVEVEIIDPYDGTKDLNDKLIRAVGIPEERFSEDALRMMRAIRIASQIGFNIEEKTFGAIKNNSGLINKIANERIRDELLKTLASPQPAHGMELLKESGLMQEILPELLNAFGVEQKSPGRHHIHDVGTHSILSLKFVSEINPDPIVRLATLIHDIGKPQTFKRLDSGTITFYNHEMVGSKIAKKIADRLRLSKRQKEKLYKLVRWHQFSVSEKQTDSAIRRFIRNVGIENVPDMLDLRTGDRLGGGASMTSWRTEEFKRRLIEVQKQPFTVRDLKISGDEVMDIMEIKPGPEVGEILETLYNEVVEKNLANDEEELRKRLKNIKQNAR